eukprot:5234316-Pleurochrysis_carterae.AAC.9
MAVDRASDEGCSAPTRLSAARPCSRERSPAQFDTHCSNTLASGLKPSTQATPKGWQARSCRARGEAHPPLIR